MDTVLIVLTGASVAAAAAFGFSAWKSRADEARRAAARVAALSAAIDGWEPLTCEPLTSTASAREPAAVTPMFATTSGASMEGRPFLKMVVFAALATAFLVVVVMANRHHDVAPVTLSPDEATLELVSMQHKRDGRAFTVTGLVRNPREGVPRSHISAVVFAFDRSGGFLASGRAALDFINLVPGDESPFVVRIPDVSGIARYRVSFRTEAGIVRHLDRRSEVAGGLRASVN